MTTVTIRSVGLVAHFSTTGDRAFRYAYSLARRRGLRLNIFGFFDETEFAPSEQEQELVREDRALREYYEPRLGDFLDVGFRICEGRKETELRRCLVRREYEVLVVPYLDHGAAFAESTVEDFAFRFPSPVVLVGPWRKVRYLLNPPAIHVIEQLRLFAGSYRPLPPLRTDCRIG